MNKTTQHDEESIHSQETAVCDFSRETKEPRFSTNKKRLIVAICCATGIISPLSANAYFPALNVIQEVNCLCIHGCTTRNRKEVFDLNVF